jgi:hypothetical protein
MQESNVVSVAAMLGFASVIGQVPTPPVLILSGQEYRPFTRRCCRHLYMCQVNVWG